MRGTRLLTAALALFLLFPAAYAASQDTEELPQIFFEKKVYSDTVRGKRSFFETHVVEKGESLWKIFQRSRPLTPSRYSELLKEFRRANPDVKDPSLLKEGQKILVPSRVREEPPEDGRSVAYQIKKGDTLSQILVSHGVPGSRLKEYLEAARELNPVIEDVNLIYAGRTVRIPTDAYFRKPEAPAQVAAAAPPEPQTVRQPAAPSSSAGESEPVPAAAGAKPAAEPGSEAALPAREALPPPEPEVQATARPQAELLEPKTSPPGTSFVETGKKEPEREPVVAPATSPYRGLLSDIFNALGEKWIEKGTMFLPLPSGEEVVLLLPDFPLVKFQGGEAALIDFRGGLPQRVREGITQNWNYIRVVSLEGANSAEEMIDRILKVSGYHSVKEGITHPLVIGETVSVVLPARWVIQRTENSLLSGDLVLLKQTPEKPSEGLIAVLRYARRVGVRVLPFADDPKVGEGFLLGIEEEKEKGIPTAFAIPEEGGLAAVDFSLKFLGVPSKEGERLRIGGKGRAFQLVVQPERLFEAGGKSYVVDTGKISDAIRTILKDSGYVIFTVRKNEPGRAIFERLAKTAGWRIGPRREHILSGGADAGYAVQLSGSSLSPPATAPAPEWKYFLVRGKAHSATRALLRDLGVEIVEW